MKNTSFTFMVLILLSLWQTACRRDEAELPSPDDCFISANVDGLDYRWELANCSLANKKLRVGDIASDEAELTLEPIDGTGAFSGINPSVDLTLFLTLGPAFQIFAADVEVKVTSFSNVGASGTFEGIFTDIGGTTYLVANGRFRAVY